LKRKNMMRINLHQSATTKKILGLHYKGFAIMPPCFDSQFCPGPPQKSPFHSAS
jgi:hypothetical protein